MKVLDGFANASKMFEKLADAAEDFSSSTILQVLRRAPELERRVEAIRAQFKYDDDELRPIKKADADFDDIAKRVRNIEADLDEQLKEYRRELK
jgi:hypothetical protein